MMVQFLPDTQIEKLAYRLLKRYEAAFGAVANPPVPVEDIADGLLDLRIMWDCVPEAAGTSTLAGLDPGERMIRFNENRREIFEETQGLYNTVLGHEIGHWELHVHHDSASQLQLPKFDKVYECIYQEATSSRGLKETQAHRFMGFLLMPSHLLFDVIREVELTEWQNLYALRKLFQVTITALTIRLERLGVLYVAPDRRLYPSLQEYHGQIRLGL